MSGWGFVFFEVLKSAGVESRAKAKVSPCFEIELAGGRIDFILPMEG